jgi:hypothetical protein
MARQQGYSINTYGDSLNLPSAPRHPWDPAPAPHYSASDFDGWWCEEGEEDAGPAPEPDGESIACGLLLLLIHVGPSFTFALPAVTEPLYHRRREGDEGEVASASATVTVLLLMKRRKPNAPRISRMVT